MKKQAKKLWYFFKETQTFIGVLLSFGVFTFVKLDYLLTTISLPYWQLALFIIIPYLVYYVFWLRFKITKRKFKTGDAVMPLNENIKYIVYYYKFLQPRVAVCKLEGYNKTLYVRDNFLQYYQEPDVFERTIKSIISPTIDSSIAKL